MATGIDYGLGKTNIDTETGIRYGVISGNILSADSLHVIQQDGEDADYAETVENLRSELTHAIKSVLEDYSAIFDAQEIAQGIIDDLEFDLESTGDCVHYVYHSPSEGLTLQTCSDGDIFIIKSDYYALCSFCSPCAPGAGHLSTEGDVKTYCLSPEWFDTDNPIPYRCFKVSDDSEITA